MLPDFAPTLGHAGRQIRLVFLHAHIHTIWAGLPEGRGPPEEWPQCTKLSGLAIFGKGCPPRHIPEQVVLKFFHRDQEIPAIATGPEVAVPDQVVNPCQADSRGGGSLFGRKCRSSDRFNNQMRKVRKGWGNNLLFRHGFLQRNETGCVNFSCGQVMEVGHLRLGRSFSARQALPWPFGQPPQAFQKNPRQWAGPSPRHRGSAHRTAPHWANFH